MDCLCEQWEERSGGVSAHSPYEEDHFGLGGQDHLCGILSDLFEEVFGIVGGRAGNCQLFTAGGVAECLGVAVYDEEGGGGWCGIGKFFQEVDAHAADADDQELG